MTFTDEDLKRLKTCTPLIMSGGDVFIQLPTQVNGLGKFERFNISALLARLEAAELWAKCVCRDRRDCPDYKAWRKEVGK